MHADGRATGTRVASVFQTQITYLIRVSHHKQRGVRPSDLADQLKLAQVGVLALIHQDVLLGQVEGSTNLQARKYTRIPPWAAPI